ENEGGTMPGICSLLVRREAFAQIGAFEKEFRGAYEDQVFLAKMFLQTRIFVTGTCSDRYRQHDGSCCAQALKTGQYHPELPHPARRTYLEWLRGYLAHEGVDDPALLAALRKELKPYDHALLYGSRLRVRYAGRLVRRALVRALESVLRSEEHTSELQSLTNLVCRLLLEKKKKTYIEDMVARGAMIRQAT